MPDYNRLNPIKTVVNSPTDVTLDAYENIYVVESISNRLIIFSQSGRYLNTKIGFAKPMSVAVDKDGKIYVANKNRGNVEVYNPDLIYLYKLGGIDWEFSEPNDIAISSTGIIYVVDKLANMVKMYNPDGSYHSYFGSSGNGEGQFHSPRSLAIDRAAGELVVLDHPLILDQYGNTIEGARVQTFAMDGTYIGGFSRCGNQVGQMFRPQHVTVDSEGRFYVTDSYHNVVIVYDREGTYLGDVYDMDSPFRTPLGIISGNSNRLFIASLNTGKVEIYGITPYTNMQLTPLSLDFQGQQNGNNPQPMTVEIKNNGTEVLDWTASCTDNWITLSDTSGSLDGLGTVNLEIGINMEGLSPNTYSGTVNVISHSGAAEKITVNLIVSANPPTANPGGVYSSIEGQSILLDGSHSSGGLVSYEWDVNYDGVSDSYEYYSLLPTQSHVYASQGTYIIKLRVTDVGNNTDTATTSAEISDSVPSADFNAVPVEGTAPLAVNFINISTGYDQPLRYEWDFDNDGSVDSTELNPLHVYENAEIFTVSLTVTDSDGSRDTLIRPYYVNASFESCPNLPLRIAGDIPQYFNTLMEAYNAASQGDVIQSRTVILTENPLLNLNKTVTLEGGYDCDYVSSTGKTMISGSLNIGADTVTIHNFILN